MADSKALKRMVGGGLVAALMFASLGDGDALAAKKKRARKRGKSLVVQRISVAGSANVPANSIIEFTFNTDLDTSTVGHAFIQIRAENATQTGFTKQVFGSFQVDGNVVRFYPRLPTHLRDPSSATGRFYPAGSIKDNATENAGLQAGTAYEIRLMGNDSFSPMRTKRGRPLRSSVVTEFSTAPGSDPSQLYTTSSYQDSPPPQYSFSNPPDRVPAVDDQYTHVGGTRDVPNDISVSVFCTKVPLSPTTARISGNIELTQTERDGNPDVRRPIGGDVFIEQNFATTLLVQQPTFPLTDRSTYALRVRKSVKDLTEEYDFSGNIQRTRLRAIYDWLANARADNPGTPPGELTDPPADLIPDWPDDEAERAILKENMLILGDTRPDEVDPRVIVLFTTRDEPVSDANLVINFLRAEDLYDARISTAEWDQTVPGAASAILTVAGGSAADGDFLPSADVTLNLDTFPDHTANFRDVLIPEDVTVTIESSIPGQLRAINFVLNGTIDASGKDGERGGPTNTYSQSTSPTAKKGGKGGPGGGKGADSSTYYRRASGPVGKGETGEPGYDLEGTPALPEDGGQGGLGGETAISTYYQFGGGGGGGGAKLAGGAGDKTNYPTWGTGAGGVGGAGSQNDDLDPLVGGAGGGSGGNSTINANNWNWNKTAAGGGGGGGAVQVQTARAINVGSEGVFRANGGKGGDGTGQNGTLNAGPGGGGGGGSYLLRTTGGFNFVDDQKAFDVNGGKGGTQTGSYTAKFGGDGGQGYVRLEDPDGGESIPGVSSGGTYDPIGGGVPSLLYSKFADLGVQDPRVLNFSNEDIQTRPTTNDAIFIEIQMTREHPSLFGQADLSAIDPDTQETTDTSVTSPWLPAKIHDNTGTPGGAFDIPDYNPGVQGNEYTFPIDALNGKGYRFVRFRITFQLDDLHARTDPIPYVDKLTLPFQFNF